MSSVAVRNHLSTFLETLVTGDSQALTSAAHEYLTRAEDASELIGQVGLIAMHGDSDGHTVLTLGAASVLTRWLIALRHVLGEESSDFVRGVPLVVQALLAAIPAVQAGKDAPRNYPEPLFPSGLSSTKSVGDALHEAIEGRDVTMVERLLLGLYGTGADYRTISIRIYDGIAQTFQEGGHALLCAIGGAKVLDAVEWGDDEPNYLHWLAPHLTSHAEEPAWTERVRGFLRESQHSLQSYRTRLSLPKNEQALPLQALIISTAPTPDVLQGVYDALIKNGASAKAVGAVIALAAANLLQNVGDGDRELFVRATHGLLFASATHQVFTQVQEVEALPLLFTAAAYVNALAQDLNGQTSQGTATRPGTVGGGLIASALLESLDEQIEAEDVAGALATARRYVQLGHDAPALISAIGLSAARADAAADQGHTLQIIQAAGHEYLSWPQELKTTSIDSFLHIALRAAALAKRNPLATH